MLSNGDNSGSIKSFRLSTNSIIEHDSNERTLLFGGDPFFLNPPQYLVETPVQKKAYQSGEIEDDAYQSGELETDAYRTGEIEEDEDAPGTMRHQFHKHDIHGVSHEMKD